MWKITKLKTKYMLIPNTNERNASSLNFNYISLTKTHGRWEYRPLPLLCLRKDTSTAFLRMPSTVLWLIQTFCFSKFAAHFHFPIACHFSLCFTYVHVCNLLHFFFPFFFLFFSSSSIITLPTCTLYSRVPHLWISSFLRQMFFFWGGALWSRNYCIIKLQTTIFSQWYV